MKQSVCTAALVLSLVALGCGGEAPAATEAGDAALLAGRSCRNITRIGVACDGTQIQRPQIRFLYLGSWWRTNGTGSGAEFVSNQQATDQRWSTVVADGRFWSMLSEYGVGQGTWGGSIVIEVDPPAKVGRDDIRNYAYWWGVHDASTINLVILPPGTTLADSSAIGFHGYDPGNWFFGPLVFGASSPPFRGGFLADKVVSHEITEAAVNPWAQLMTGCTDRIDSALNDPPPPGSPPGSGPAGDNEIGDLCNGKADSLVILDGVTVQRVWSQRACACIGPQ